MNDKVPFVVGSIVSGALPMVPGPTENEWGGAIVGVLALLVRELFWWFRNRKA